MLAEYGPKPAKRQRRQIVNSRSSLQHLNFSNAPIVPSFVKVLNNPRLATDTNTNPGVATVLLNKQREDQEAGEKTIKVGSGTEHSDLKKKQVCSLEVQKVFDVETERGLKSELLDLNVHQDQDQLRSKKMEIEIEIEAKLDDLRLRDSKSGNNLEEESVQATCSLPAIVDVEDMTSEDYFNDPLGHFAVHEELLKDESRMQGWQAVSTFL